MKNTIVTLQKRKQNRQKITMLTAYDYTTAKLMDESGVDCLLVGDSLGMVMLGYDSTVSVTMDDMIHHSKAVARAAKSAFVVTDLPFMSYHTSVYDAVLNAGRLVKEGQAQAVKLEGGQAFCEHIKMITQASIPVIAHIGLMPQSVLALGGYKVQGKDYQEAKNIVLDALAVEQAGAVAILLECVPADLAKIISELVSIPTIGIGAGVNCDGQVLVYQDMLSMYDGISSKFVKSFGSIGDQMKQAFKQYCQEVNEQQFPAAIHEFAIDNDIIEKLKLEFTVNKKG
ncbi:3-methyl-2-oxobutanoate hydroxymethyltransferase [Gilliamella sp. Fer1-1]|uniref:3-methyl-2-oxobutanoate hydroxymethyltransferase n=1 Tax=unclassified Gilliamella TaxID=2685620 RepID=UPI00080DEE30|nr:3-methyl-2-oxobutanoate hydroxymethyltransferase [Gilliamella apicola]OCG24154.1 3-methyl-2-oxobutanoate hydroxymethyltransferase [Gilliamella apicola]OCG26165.1 3-methyl-2-oxobutanoate hydroxymethyltransferase [Gilliamella apicola]OCG32783.1 3-methyl-2-oxobutanoate hydroxymethyltransferase [Gilliamella apicola]OCG41273.1 3-methyl-2-oxobutanoate hydroxymethyltransferase [Gilliamella apicola]OCG69537.1 3-methyl-2-oxobutanoate hydroxymethyltransferase [Gilliamella apicola]